MFTKEHVKRTGNDYKTVHVFIDRFTDEYGLDHRVIWHHQVGIEILVEIFGEELRWVIEQHMRDDYVDEGKIPQNYMDTNFFRREWSFIPKKYDRAYELANILHIIFHRWASKQIAQCIE